MSASMKQVSLFGMGEANGNNSTRDMSMNIFLGNRDYSSGKKNAQLFEDDEDTEADVSHQIICGACHKESEDPVKCAMCATHSCRACYQDIVAGARGEFKFQCPANGCLLEESQVIGASKEDAKEDENCYKTCPHC